MAQFQPCGSYFYAAVILPVVFIVIRVNGCERLVMSGFDFQETDFYAREYVYVGNPELKPEKGGT